MPSKLFLIPAIGFRGLDFLDESFLFCFLIFRYRFIQGNAAKSPDDFFHIMLVFR